jgi:mRNA interferase MazF
MVDLDPTIGHEQAGKRPALVLSVDPFNQSPAELVIVLPLTSRDKGIRSHVEIPQGTGGLRLRSFVKCEDVRSISTQRLGRRLGAVGSDVLERAEDIVRILLGL